MYACEKHLIGPFRMTQFWRVTTTFSIPDLSSDRVSDACLILVEIRARQSVRKQPLRTCPNDLFFRIPQTFPAHNSASFRKVQTLSNTSQRNSAWPHSLYSGGTSHRPTWVYVMCLRDL